MKGDGTNIDAFVGETRRDCGRFFFSFGEEDWEFLDSGHRDIATIVAGQKGLYDRRSSC